MNEENSNAPPLIDKKNFEKRTAVFSFHRLFGACIRAFANQLREIFFPPPFFFFSPPPTPTRTILYNSVRKPVVLASRLINIHPASISGRFVALEEIEEKPGGPGSPRP